MRSPARTAGSRLDRLVRRVPWTDAAVDAAGLEVRDVPFVTVGGGLASFALVDFLRIARVRSGDIAVVSPQRLPHDNWRYLVGTSQIPDDDPLRSDSMSRIDNIWGWPGYAVEQALRDRTAAPLWNVLTEPILTDFYNPKAALVYSGLEREARRIGWDAMLVEGWAQLVRPRAGGGYFVLVHPVEGGAVAYRCRHAHLGLGYPAVRYLPDLQDYRSRHRDLLRAVNAYEPHEHVYQVLRRRPGTVVVRGAGIVASRVLQRLIDDRDDHGARTRIVHLVRSEPSAPAGPRRFRRPAGDGWSYQAFTFAKAAGGGQFRQRALALEGEERAAFIASIGGTTTARRRHWQGQLRRGRAQGFYRLVQGEVADLSPQGEGLCVATRGPAGKEVMEADFLLDCTGLDPDVRQHPILADLLDRAGADVNPMGRLDVDPRFGVRGTASGDGRLYASGAMTLGGYLAPVDSFWGFSHAAVEICDDLARRGFCPRIGLRRSVSGWWRWMRNTAP